jgi:hypothetical protein
VAARGKVCRSERFENSWGKMQSAPSIQHNDSQNFKKYFSGSSCLWLFTCVSNVTNGAEHHILLILNKTYVDSTQLHKAECKEIRGAINKGYSRQNTVPEIQGCYFRNTETAQPTYITSKPTEPEKTFVKMLHQCRPSCFLTARYPAVALQETDVFVSKADVRWITRCYVPDPTNATFST